MPLVPFNNLTPEQRATVTAMYPGMRHYEWYAFPVKANGELWKKRGHHRLTEDGARSFFESVRRKYPLDDDVRSKGDLRDWSPGVRFTFSKG